MEEKQEAEEEWQKAENASKRMQAKSQVQQTTDNDRDNEYVLVAVFRCVIAHDEFIHYTTEAQICCQNSSATSSSGRGAEADGEKTTDFY